MSSTLIILLALAVLIVAGLGFWAGRLLFALRAQTRQQNAIREARIDDITQSIALILKALNQQQCELAEAVIRLYHLLGALPIVPAINPAQDYPQLTAFYQQVSRFAILEDRKTLSKQQRMREDLQRMELEAQYESILRPEIAALTERFVVAAKS